MALVDQNQTTHIGLLLISKLLQGSVGINLFMPLQAAIMQCNIYTFIIGGGCVRYSRVIYGLARLPNKILLSINLLKFCKRRSLPVALTVHFSV